MDNEASMIYVHTFISKANSKFFHQKFTLTWDAGADANPYSTLFKACRCLFMSSKKAFKSYMIFKCVLAIWLHSLTVEISDVPFSGEVVSLSPRKLETIWTFFGMHRREKLR